MWSDSEFGGFPRLYAAASLKPRRQRERNGTDRGFSAALCRGLIEAHQPSAWSSPVPSFSAALCRGLIEAWRHVGCYRHWRKFSAALCRGLIEAKKARSYSTRLIQRFPRLYAAASLKLIVPGLPVVIWLVFRGFMPRPH